MKSAARGIGEGNTMKTGSMIAAVALATLWAAGTAAAAEIKVVRSVGVRAVLEELAPQFERASEHKVKIRFGTAVPLKRQIDGGESFDVVILTPALVQDLVQSGKVAAATPTDVAKSGIGVAIRAGAPKPDISSTEALKRSLINAKSIVYSKEGQSGTYMARLIERLGLAEQMRDKTVLETRSGHTAVAVVEGKAELGFVLVSEILPVAGAEYAGPLPADLQNHVVFTAGIGAAAKEAEAAKSFINFLKAPAAAAVLKAKGMEPAN
jgi:molybdate transport system substrate-binding protein